MPNKLTKEEKELHDSYENDEWESIQTEKNTKKYQALAREIFKKDKCVEIRISGKDLESSTRACSYRRNTLSNINV